MKKFGIYFFCALFLSTSLTSCGGGDEDGSTSGNNNNGNNSGASRRIVSVVNKTEGTNFRRTITYYYHYDSQGRIVVILSNSSDGTTATREYSYNPTMITESVKSQYPVGNDSYVNTYELSNGRIVNEKKVTSSFGSGTNWKHNYRTSNYTYDSNGYMISSIEKNHDTNIETNHVYTWENGNLTKDVRSSSSWSWGSSEMTYTYTYSNIPWPKGFFSDYYIGTCDQILMSMGYYGNLPKNLPTSLSKTYEYSLSGRDIGTVTFKDGGYVTTLTYTWE